MAVTEHHSLSAIWDHLSNAGLFGEQNEGLDTVEANERLGYPPDLRDYSDAARILRTLGVIKVKLLTNNPSKVNGLEQNGIQVVERLAIETGPGPVNLNYLRVKKTKLGHIFEAI